MIYVILGMHKSGTTLVSNLLHQAGINMVQGQITGDYDAEYFFERQSTRQLNIDITGLQPQVILDYAAPTNLTLSLAHQQRMQRIIGELSQNYDDWGFKDPRTCLTYPLWESQLPEHRLIIIYRSVADIWHRYQYDGKRFWRNLTRAIALVARWCEYNSRIIETLERTQCSNLIITYDDLMASDQEFQRLAHFLQYTLVDTRRAELNRGKVNAPYRIIELAKWIVQRRFGYHYQNIWEQLHAFRQAQIND